jgi:hypothetical protein
MEHPSLDISKLAELKLDEIQSKISDITGRLNFAYQANNANLIHQLGMVLESYNIAYKRKIDETLNQGKDNISDKIDIS